MDLAVVVPCFNEAENVSRLVTRLETVLDGLDLDSYQLIFVDDGSTDATLHQLRCIADDDAAVSYLSFSRNFGKESAMLAGLAKAEGDAVAILDADLQHPPELLADMLPLLADGFDQVVARRTRAGDAKARTAAARLFYRMINSISEVTLADGVGDFRLISRRVVDGLLSLDESNRFSKGLFSWVGFSSTDVEYDNVTREAGTSKWSTRQLINYAMDGLLSFNVRPLRIAIYFGLTVAAAAFLYAIFITIQVFAAGVSVPGYVTTICAIVLFGGLQMVMIGIIGEYVGRIYLETKSRPHYIVREVGNLPAGVPERNSSARAHEA